MLKRVSGGDERAFKTLFDMFYGRLFDLAIFHARDHFAAQEVVSQVFVKLWANRTAHFHVDGFQAYLYIAVKRQSLNYIRNNNRRNNISIRDVKLEHFSDIRHTDDGLLHDELIKVLNTAINQLPFKCRLVYQMVKEDGLRYREVAEMLGISVKAVEMHIGKALQRIRQELKTYYPSKSWINPN